MRIAVVEDEKLARETLVRLIRQCDDNYRVVVEAQGANQALDEIIHRHPEILITDINMPNHDGLWLIEMLKKHGISLYPIIISGHSEFKYAQKAIQLGVKSYLLKPFTLSDIKELLNEAASYLRINYNHSFAMPNGVQDVSELVKGALELISNNMDKNCSLNEVAAMLYVTPEHLSRLFKKEVGINFSIYVTDIKMEGALAMLNTTQMSANDIAHSLGYADVKYFKKVLKEKTGKRFSELVQMRDGL